MNSFRAYCAEFIGTFFLVLTVCIAGVLGYAGPYAPIAIGATLMVMVYATGYVSGGHLNPAVTLAAWVRGKFPSRQVLPYIVAQLLAGVVAAWAAKMFIRPGITVTPSTFSFYPALAAEFLYTFALCYVVLNVATAEGNDGNNFYGLAIGFTVMVGAFTVGKISGGVFNPAVAVGLTGIGSVSSLNSGVYYIGDVAGGVIAGLVFDFLNSEKKEPTLVTR
ncbi:MAG TPA: MIP/aquaporin family protein [Chthoniobacterales bacterium]|nr:MIP/aquaporin family protein [Chthoniobacterales bacterium]